MIFKPTTLLPSSPPPNFNSIDDIIFYLWDRHLELELRPNQDEVKTIQNLDVTAAIIDYWEGKLTEINDYEIRQRRSNLSKND